MQAAAVSSTPDLERLRRTMADCQLRTFDITNAAVIDAFESLNLDQVLFVPAAAQPLKSAIEASPGDRLGMVGAMQGEMAHILVPQRRLAFAQLHAEQVARGKFLVRQIGVIGHGNGFRKK